MSYIKQKFSSGDVLYASSLNKMDEQIYKNENDIIQISEEIVNQQTQIDGKQPKGNYLTSIPSEYVTETELTAKGYAVKSSAETWTFTLEDGTTVTKKVVLA